MQSGEIRVKFLTDHAYLRGKAGVVESLALHVLRGDHELSSALQLKGEELQSHMLEHMRWEEIHLLPLLPKDAQAGYGAEDFLEAHQEQREALAQSLISLRAATSQAPELAKLLLEFVKWLERDIVDEELSILSLLDGPPGLEGQER